MKLVSARTHIVYCLSFSPSRNFLTTNTIYYIESLLEILYAKPIATKSVMTPAEMVIIKFVLIT